MKQVKNQVYLTEGGLPIDPGRTTMGLGLPETFELGWFRLVREMGWDLRNGSVGLGFQGDNLAWVG
jgi:hypothetical protein